MKSRLFCTFALVLAFLLLSSCAIMIRPFSSCRIGTTLETVPTSEPDTTVHGDWPAMIMVDGELYYRISDVSLPSPFVLTIIGETTSYTDSEPTKNGETNFSRKLGLPIARFGQYIAVQVDGEWELFAKESNPESGKGPGEEIPGDPAPLSEARSLRELREQVPQYFGLGTFKGLEIYAWSVAPSAYRFGILTGTNRLKTEQELTELTKAPVSAEELITILNEYGLSDSGATVLCTSCAGSSNLPVDFDRMAADVAALLENRYPVIYLR